MNGKYDSYVQTIKIEVFTALFININTGYDKMHEVN